MTDARLKANPTWQLYVPKLVTLLRRGYGFKDFQRDAVAGLTVAIVALPLAMALAIASGTTPEKGLHTAIIAGFLISALGGSRVQIGGPTAAFIPVVFTVTERFGYGGLILCTLLAGLMLIAAGLFRIGTLMKFMPQPVITGFTAGIAVSIFLSQVKDLLGLRLGAVPAEFYSRLGAYAEHFGAFNPWSASAALASVVIIVMLRRWRPLWPGFLIAVGGVTLVCVAFGIHTETIGTLLWWHTRGTATADAATHSLRANPGIVPEFVHYRLPRRRRIAPFRRGRRRHDRRTPPLKL